MASFVKLLSCDFIILMAIMMLFIFIFSLHILDNPIFAIIDGSLEKIFFLRSRNIYIYLFSLLLKTILTD